MKMYKLDARGSACYYYDTDSVWIITETDKAYSFKRQSKVTQFVASSLPDAFKISKGGDNRHTIRDWQDGSFTVYFNKDGQPLVFEELE